MIQKMYAVRDKVADLFFPPFLSQNDETAKRDFRVSGLSGDIPNFSDYELHAVATYDNHTGLVESVPDTVLMHGYEVKRGDSSNGDDN